MRHPFASRLFAGLAAALLSGLAGAQSVVGWGSDADGTLSGAAALANVRSVSLGATHGAATLFDGTVVCWGGNAQGQTAVPKGLRGVLQVVAGTANTVALKGDGSLVAWGLADAPTPVFKDFVQVAAGTRGNLALRSGGTVVYWGAGADFMAPPANLRGVVAIAEGGANGAALKKDGTVVIWGRNDAGQLAVPKGLKDVAQVGVGDGYVVALLNTGRVVAWGSNAYRALDVPSGLPPVDLIAAGPRHVLAELADGSVVAWGDRTGGKCDVPALLGASSLAAGPSGSIAVTRLGVTLQRGRLHLGDRETAVVTLAEPAPPGGATVLLDVSDDRVVVPAKVLVPAGARSVSFTVESGDRLPKANPVRVTAAYRDGTSAAVLTVYGVLPDLELSANEIVGGSVETLSGRVYLEDKASKPATVTLVSNDPAATLPATVVVPAKSRVAEFTVTHSLVPNDRTVFIQAAASTRKGASLAELHLVPARATVAFDPATVASGGTVSLAATLNARLRNDATVALSTAVGPVELPASLRVPAGEASASVTLATPFLGTATSVDVLGTFNSGSSTARLGLLANSLSVSLAKPRPVGGERTTGTVTLGAPLARAATVSLASDAPGLVSVPASVTIPAGATSATFDVTTAITPTIASATVEASLAGYKATATITLNVLTVRITPPITYLGGIGTKTVPCTLTLNASVAVPATVELSSSDAVLLSAPASVTIPADSLTGNFDARVTVGEPKSVYLTARLNGGQVSAAFSLTPVTTSLTLPTGLVGGQAGTGTITLSQTLSSVNLIVPLSTDRSDLLTLPATVLVPAGKTSATFAFSTALVDETVAAKITSGTGTLANTKSLSLTPATATVSVDRAAVVGGTVPVVATVRLNAVLAVPETVAIAIDRPELASVPPTVVVPAGSQTASFAFTPAFPAANTDLRLTATLHGTSVATVRVVTVAGVFLDLPTEVVYGYGSSSYGRWLGTPFSPPPGVSLPTVPINGVVLSTVAPPAGATITLVGDGPVSMVQPSVVATGHSTAFAEVALAPSGGGATATITATLPDVGTATNTTTVVANRLADLALSAATVQGGGTVSGTATLTLYALAAQGVTLSCDDPAVTLPSSATVAGPALRSVRGPGGPVVGQTAYWSYVFVRTASFTISTTAVTVPHVVTITATSGGASKTFTLTIMP